MVTIATTKLNPGKIVVSWEDLLVQWYYLINLAQWYLPACLLVPELKTVSKILRVLTLETPDHHSHKILKKKSE